MRVAGITAQEVFAQEPDAVGGLQRIIILTALQLLTVEVGPGVQDAGGQVAMGHQLDLGLIEPGVRITGFDIDDAEFIGEEFAFVVRVEDVDLGDRAGQVAAEGGVEKMDKQVAVVLGAQQGFEDTVGLGVDRVVHGESLGGCGGRGNGALRGARSGRWPVRGWGASAARLDTRGAVHQRREG